MTSWQDWVLAAGLLVFSMALVPSIQSQNKPALSTSGLTALVLGIFVIVYFSLSLWFSVVATGINCILWGYWQFKNIGSCINERGVSTISANLVQSTL